MSAVKTVGRAQRSGNALVMSLVCVGSLAALSMAMVTMSSASMNEQRAASERVVVEYLAQAGIETSIAAVKAGANGDVGSQQTPQSIGGGTYFVAVTNPVAGQKILTATANANGNSAALELTLREVSTSLWRYAAFGDIALHMDSNARVDSYDSHGGTYAAQAVNGSGTDQHASVNGDVGSNGNITLDQNSQVWGDATCGPSGSTVLLVNAEVTGSQLPSSEPMALDPILVPTYASSGDMSIAANTTIAAGDYYWPNFVCNNNRTVTITGPANIVVNNFRLRSGAQFVVDASAGPVNLYVIDNFVLNSNSLLYSTNYVPGDLRVNLVSDNIADPDVTITLDTIDFASNTKMWGALYAPNALITINSNFELFGALIARQVDLDSNGFIHYDESLASDLGALTTEWQKVAFRKVSTNPVVVAP